jgi:hypothetical protein
MSFSDCRRSVKQTEQFAIEEPIAAARFLLMRPHSALSIQHEANQGFVLPLEEGGREASCRGTDGAGNSLERSSPRINSF